MRILFAVLDFIDTLLFGAVLKGAWTLIRQTWVSPNVRAMALDYAFHDMSDDLAQQRKARWAIAMNPEVCSSERQMALGWIWDHPYPEQEKLP